MRMSDSEIWAPTTCGPTALKSRPVARMACGSVAERRIAPRPTSRPSHSPSSTTPAPAGAGDWGTAGMLYELFGAAVGVRTIDRKTIKHALAFGQVLSTLNCMTEGARGLLATWSPDQIVRAARSAMQARTGSGQFVDQTFRRFAHDVGLTSSTTALRGDGFGCCSQL